MQARQDTGDSLDSCKTVLRDKNSHGNKMAIVDGMILTALCAPGIIRCVVAVVKSCRRISDGRKTQFRKNVLESNEEAHEYDSAIVRSERSSSRRRECI